MVKMNSATDAVPDGGWGWIVVAAVALINMTNQSILSVYGLLFGTKLLEMQQETFTAALITNLNSLALNFSGLFVGPAIKSFKPRNVSATGCMMVSFGLIICAFSSQGWHFIVGYSFFVGMGLGLISASTFMAINSYFSKKRGRAVGVSLAGAGLGQVFIPHVVRVFLDYYGFRVAVLVMALMSLTGIFGAFMLKPLSFHTKKHNQQKQLKLLLETENENKEKEMKTNSISDVKIVKMHEPLTNEVYKNTVITPSKEGPLCSKVCHRLVEALDLELLKDPIFLSIILGMALVYTSTINFTMLFPTFLQTSVGLSSTTTATCMSVVAGADIICRLLLPCITDKLQVPYRIIFLLGTVGLLISRAALAESTDITSIIVMSVFTGMTKSATVLNNNLTISGHCRPEKLPGGLGLNMIAKGVLVISVGQLLGWIRDYTGSYILALQAQNLLLLLVVIVWTPEICFRLWQQRRRLKIEDTNPEEIVKMNAC